MKKKSIPLEIPLFSLGDFPAGDLRSINKTIAEQKKFFVSPAKQKRPLCVGIIKKIIKSEEKVLQLVCQDCYKLVDGQWVPLTESQEIPLLNLKNLIEDQERFGNYLVAMDTGVAIFVFREDLHSTVSWIADGALVPTFPAWN
jgi:hypothetical protein